MAKQNFISLVFKISILKYDFTVEKLIGLWIIYFTLFFQGEFRYLLARQDISCLKYAVKLGILIYFMKCVIKEESGLCVPRVGTTTCFHNHLLSRK